MMGKILVSVGALIALMLCAAFVVPYLIKWNSYKGFIETRAREVTGQPLLIDGNVTVRILPQPVIRAEKVRLGDQSEDTRPALLSAEAFEAAFSIPAMLRGVWEVTHIRMVRPVLHIERDGNRLSTAGGRPFDALKKGDRIAVDRMDVTGGTLILRDTRRGVDLTVGQINAEFQATSLTGPYRVNGRLGEGARKFSLATGRLSDDGNLRLTASVELGDGQVRFSGQADDLFAVPRLEGKLLVSAKDGPGRRLNVESPLNWDGSELSLPELRLNAEANGGQARFEGKLKVDWTAMPAFKGELAARRIDFDALGLGGGEDGFDPLAEARRLLKAHEALLPKLATGTLDLGIRSGVVNGESFSALQSVLSFRTGALAGLSGNVALPGRGRLSLDGTFAPPDAAAGAGAIYSGKYALKAEDVKTLLVWAGAGKVMPGRRQPVGVKLAGDLKLEMRRLAATASGQFGGAPVAGSLSHDEAENAFEVDLDGGDLDVTGFVAASGESAPGDAASAEGLWLRALVRPSLWAKRFPWLGVGTRDIRLKATSLISDAGTVRGLEARLRFNNGDLAVNRLAFDGAPGLHVAITGNVTSFASKAESFLQIDLALDKTMARLERFFAGNGLNRRAYGSFLGRLAPSLKTGITFSALEAGKRMSFKALGKGRFGTGTGEFEYSFEGEPEKLAEGKSVLKLALSHARAATLLDQIGAPMQGGGWRPGAGEVTLSVDGTPAQLMELSGKLEVPDGEAGMKATLEGGKSLGVADGRLEMKLARLDGLLGRFGFAGKQIPPDMPFSAAVSFAMDERALTLASLSGQAGSAKFTGHGEITDEAGGRKTRLVLKPERLDLPLFLMALGEHENGNGAVPAGVDAGVWPTQPIALPKLGTNSFQFEVETPELKLSEQVTVHKASLEARVNASELEVERLAGAVFGGSLLASASLARRAGGVMSAEAGVMLQAADLAHMVKSAAGGPALTGLMSFELGASGRGRSLAGIVSSLDGEARLTLDDGRVMTPDLTATTLIAGQAVAEREIEKALETAIGWRGTPFITAPVKMDIKLGVASVERAGFKSGESGGRYTLHADFSTLSLDGRWLYGLAGLEGKPMLEVAHSGPLKALVRKTDLSDIRRFLTRKRIARETALPEPEPESAPVGGEKTEVAPKVVPGETAPKEPAPATAEKTVDAPQTPSGLVNETVKDLPGLGGPAR